MEEKYRQVTEIIKNLASTNPYITKEQIAKAKSMYNGDDRPIEVIQAELEAYSAQIAEQGKKKDRDKEIKFDKEESKPVERTPVEEPQPQHRPNAPEKPTLENPVTPKVEPEVEIYEPLIAELPGDSKRAELQSMIDDALGETAEQLENTSALQDSTTRSKDNAKVLVKTPEQTPNSGEGNSSSSNDGGYGNVTALLTLTIMFSIVTIIMAFFTILAN